MAYTRMVWANASGSEGVVPTARELGNLDRALFEQDARITALEAAVADLLARVIVLENP
jgi:hypothetical protein